MSPSPSATQIVVLRYNRLEHLPPALYQTQLLIENGYSLSVFEYGPKNFPHRKAPFLFGTVLWHLIRRFKKEGCPRLIIAHGIHEQTLAFYLWFFLRIPYVVDVHEVYAKSEMRGFHRFLFAHEKKALGKARLLVFPESKRRRLYEKRYNLTQPALTVFNCPRLQPERRRNTLRQTWGIDPHQYVLLYLGGVGRFNGLELAIRALKEKERFVFVIAGWAETSYLAALKNLARQEGVAERTLFLGEVKDRWEVLRACDFGYCVYEPIPLRLRFAATASNKLMEYFAAGLPVLCNAKPDFRLWVEKENTGQCLNVLDSRQVSCALSWWEQNPREVARQSANARALHRTELHYERQWRPLRESIKSLVLSAT